MIKSVKCFWYFSIRTKRQCCVLYPFEINIDLETVYFQNTDKVDYKSACFNSERNSPSSLKELKFSAINVAIRSLFSLIILKGISSC